MTVLTLFDLAKTHLELDEAAAAKQRFDESLQRLEQARLNQTYGDAPTALMSVRAAVLVHAARAETRLGEMVRAEVQLREALGLMEERWGKTAPQLVVPCTELAQLLLASQRRDEARAMCERAASVARSPAQLSKLSELRKLIDA